jgi:hydrogenase/urease accessory protein HupE
MIQRAHLGMLALSLLGALVPARSVSAHEMDTFALSLREVAEGRFLVTWHAGSPTLAERLTEPAVFPEPCRLQGAELTCGAAGLVGSIELPWLGASEIRAMVQIEWLSGTRLLRVVDGRSPRLTVYGIPASAGLASVKPIAADYTRLGVEHILTGFDHVLFVLALAILVRRRRQLLATVTAFTVAHSLTLACTALGLISLPSPPVEAAIALSIVLVAAECLRPQTSLAHRAPWLVAFVFGLLHGFGFASSLLAIGLPEKHVSAALLFFNVGVELGQLGVLAVVGSLRLVLRRFQSANARATRWLVYGIGGTAAFWSIERCMAVLSQ